MALSILDGTQTATTLSTILSSGQHITAHTVVSLGTQAITDMRSAVSGSVVSIPSLPAISGTVTAVVLAYDESSEGLGELRSYSIGARGGSLEVVGPSYAGTVTANSLPCVPIFGSVTIGSALPAGTAQIGSVTASISNFPATQAVSLTTLPALVAGTAQIGSVTASLAISSTAITSGSFSSLTSATLVPANTARKMATVYNLGAGQLFVNAGATATTLGGGFMVALSSGDFYECDYTTTTLSAIFATAGTASWVSH